MHHADCQHLRWLFAVPNGGHRGKASAGKMKAEGQRTGVPDLSLPVPRVAGGRTFHGLWLELKKTGGAPSEDQWDWLTHLHRAGYAAHVVNDPDTARQLITDYLSLPSPDPI
ncbi:MAG: VRR-NUC domain-containing protein [Verrucomicrobiaceae bacterium]|nr:MAG: VRR-NUC domain-containing protein [Verrucomicrobiaceae bacterium]